MWAEVDNGPRGAAITQATRQREDITDKCITLTGDARDLFLALLPMMAIIQIVTGMMEGNKP